ncbi:MAG TPA: hypothetical protein EYG75_03570 [Campylobacterales bacterium]|nr:hypothetical protein [Campylobacterales bacterium]
MKELEVIGKEIEIYKIKLLLFMAIAGGSWVYAFKLDGLVFKMMLFSVFVLSSFGIFTNITKLSRAQEELKGFKNV